MYCSNGVLVSTAWACLMAPSAASQRFFWIASCAVLRCFPTVAPTFCCAIATDGASRAPATPVTPQIARLALSTKVAFVIESSLGTQFVRSENEAAGT